MLRKTSQDALQFIRDETKGKKRIVFVSGFFNIVHPGHLRVLRFAAECGDYLVIGVHADLYGNALIDEKTRLEGVHAITLVDYCFILEDTPQDFVKALKPDIVVKGKEHEKDFNPEAEVVKEYGGQMLFSSGDMSFSLAELLQDESQRLVSGSFARNEAYMARHQFNWSDLDKILKQFQKLKVLVIGETIVDEYITCDAMGMSQEDPTIVVTPVGVELYLGGAGIVSAHASNLGAEVSFFSISGKDEMASFINEKLFSYGVNTHIFQDESRPTILKQRYRTSGKTLLRVNHLRQHPISQELQKKIQESLLDMIPDQDLIIFSDFNYGCLPQPLVNRIVARCRQENVMMVADSQSSSQIGDVSRFKHTILMTPTEREARLALKDFESGLVVLAEKLRTKSKADNVFITLNEEGLLIHANGSIKTPFFTDRIDAMNKAPVDPAGAGDSLLTCSAMALASGADIWQSAYLGSVAAACQVGRNGNIPLSTKDMYLGTQL
ncbi:MAG: adenylyltransferase/cytidyltransferase family protein [Proteobacteria bacterium]|nr:adenylyltransferase/cytidyltransferase family protein [Pseudomonadota bacterium]MBU1388914.1 adenylyltransferase/cytidyltransferase family protein [Pseudomonadota bacterium]MBU1543466.1 adenylyltransferase/cytidyltransferase family protein [Pseudomonadota bacterium]MBU2480528.1 adenylyltransferase/cytidyltransferase family protein [Pseudomonadota bacterium]